MTSTFQQVTTLLARFIGRPVMMLVCLLLAALSIAAYVSRSDLAISGTNLAINVVTLLFLPVLQATQNRDGAALQAKLDGIRANEEARNDLIGIEKEEETVIQELRPIPVAVTDPHPEEEPIA